MAKKLIIIISILVVAGLLVNAYQSDKNKLETPTQDQTKETEKSEVNQLDQVQEDLLRGGSSFLDNEQRFSFLYPNEYVQNEERPGIIRLYKRGPSQRPQSEISDGVLIVFEVKDVADMSLSDFVDSLLAELKQDGVSEITQGKQSFRLKQYVGYTYQARGLGDFTSIVLQKDDGSDMALKVTYMVADPENKGYQAEVDAILNTLNLLK